MISEHLINRVGLEDLSPCRRGGAVVEQHRDDLDVFAWLREETCACAVENLLDLGGGIVVEGAAEEMLACGDVSVWVPLVHVREVVFHRLRGEEGHVFYLEGLENVGLDVVGQRLAGYALDENASPINSCLERQC